MADPPLTSAVLTTLAMKMAMAGEPAESAAQVAERALAGMHAAAPGGWPWSEAVRVLVVTERYDVALRELRRALRHGARADALALSASLHLRIGDLRRALEDARALAAASAQPAAQGCAVARLAEALIERGDHAEAARLFEDGPFAASAGALPAAYAAEFVLLARGRLRLEEGRIDDAIEDLAECGRRAEATGHLNPAALPWRSQLAYALLEHGDTRSATRLAADELERARACGAPRALGVALCAAARTRGDELRLLREAVAVLDESPALVERARAGVLLGSALRRAGRPLDARDPLRSALDLAHRCGARPLEERALAELRAAGARPRRRLTSGAGALTPSERRIAELAASGHKNREIADAQYLTLATVEYHLRHAYRKLGIASRAGLGAALEAC